MKAPTSPLLVLFFAGALCTSSVLADSVKLKSGEVFNGKVLRESETEVVMDVIVASGITDEKTFQKADVENVSKTTADSLLFETLKSYSVGSYSFPAATYPAMMKPLQGFLKEHPDSPHAAAVKTMLDTLKLEEERVKTGQLKWDNRWYTPEEVQKNQYELGAAMRVGQMKAQIARRDFIGALNSFASIETAYPGSSSYPDAVELALTALPSAAAEADRLQAAGKMQESQFKGNIDYVPEPQKSQMIQAWKAQVATAERTLAAASAKTELKWKPLLPLAPKSFETFKTTYAAEKSRLTDLPVASMRSSLKLTQEVEAAIQEKKVAEASEKLNEADKLWSANQKLKDLKAEVEVLKKPKPTPKPTATPTPATSPSPAEKKGKH